jgi:hypothetical protein
MNTLAIIPALDKIVMREHNGYLHIEQIAVDGISQSIVIPGPHLRAFIDALVPLVSILAPIYQYNVDADTLLE